MKHLRATLWNSNLAATSLAQIRRMLEDEMWQGIDTCNWPAFPFRPEVRFAVTGTLTELLVAYKVRESTVLAECAQINGMVCRDSCVECFFAPRNGVYFNLEFNCIGVPRVGMGSGRADNVLLDPVQVDRICRWPSLGTATFAQRPALREWSLVVAIPWNLIGLADGPRLGETYRVNFHKCGDEQTPPHYLTWNPIDTTHPDFHQPAQFGQITFIAGWKPSPPPTLSVR